MTARAATLVAALVALGAGLAGFAGAGFAQGGGLLMTIDIEGNNPEPQRPAGRVNTLQDISKAVHGCWRFPPVDQGRQPVDVIFQVSFKRSGELFGKPRVVKFSREVSPQERERFYLAVVEAIDCCSPMPFTESMGGAIAGRTLHFRLIDSRNKKQADTQWLTMKTS
jgi:hypothetical protein